MKYEFKKGQIYYHPGGAGTGTCVDPEFSILLYKNNNDRNYVRWLCNSFFNGQMYRLIRYEYRLEEYTLIE